ncbi:MAG TPA: cytochrome c [Puia sp.]|nr:cytochrome c [Puia sp.]
MQYKNALVATIVLIVLSASLMSLTHPANRSLHNDSPWQSAMDRGKKVYSDRCLTCHQADGGGVQSMNPPLIKTKWVLGDKSKLIEVVIKGMQGAVDIEGDTYHNVMPPHPDLTDQQVADVLTYVRNSFGNKARGVTEAEVKAVRAKLK